MTTVGGSLSKSDEILGKEALHVHQPYSPDNQNVLRTLKGEKAKASLATKDELSQVVQGSLGQSHWRHQRIFRTALLSAYDLFSGTDYMEGDLAAWMQGIRFPNGILRQVSSEWKTNTDHLLSRCQLPSTDELIRLTVTDPSLAFRLGAYELARNLIDSSNLSPKQKEILDLKLKIAETGDPRPLLNAIECVSPDAGYRQALVASTLVKAKRENVPVESGVALRLQDWLSSINFEKIRLPYFENREDFYLRVCHVANSLNFIYLSDNAQDLLNKNFGIVEQLSIRLDYRLSNQVSGNLKYHKSILARREENSKLEYELLENAWRTDSGFSDYAYRIAQILHDHGDERAKEYYEVALENSPLNFALVNDYGCYLNDAKLERELESWTKFATWLAPIGSGIEV